MAHETDLALELETSMARLYMAANFLKDTMPATAALLQAQADRNQQILMGGVP